MRCCFGALLFSSYVGSMCMAGDPVVSNVRASQREGTKLVDIWYDVSDADGDLLTVSVAVSENGGATYMVPAVSFSGGGYGANVTPGSNRWIVWDAGTDWGGRWSDSMRFRVTVDDGTAAGASGMVLVPEGPFLRGDNLKDGDADELPTATLTIDAFYMDEYEVTNEKMRETLQWALDHHPPLIAATAESVSNLTGNPQRLLALNEPAKIGFSGETFHVLQGKDDHPCKGVTWYGAVAYCNYRSEMEGVTPCYDLGSWSCDWNADGFRLPTEAEWEKAARGGLTGRRFPWGYSISHAHANYNGHSSQFTYDHSSGYHPDYSNGTSPVGSFPATGYGLYDMAGNVREWCWDWYLERYYDTSPTTDPHGPTNGVLRVMRGSGLNNSGKGCRVAERSSATPTFTDAATGFRTVLPAGR